MENMTLLIDPDTRDLGLEHYSLQRQRSYSDSEEEIRKNNSDAEGIRTV